MERTDEELLRDWREDRRRESLDALVARHLPRIRRLLVRLVSRESVADDLTQETFLRATSRLESFGGQAEFATWLHRIALNLTYTYWSRRARRGEAALAEDEALAPRRHRPDEQTESVERVERIERALESLSARRRAALVLVRFEGLSVEEAAAIEGCTPQAIYGRIHEARRQLRDELKDLLP